LVLAVINLNYIEILCGAGHYLVLTVIYLNYTEILCGAGHYLVLGSNLFELY